MKRKFTVDAHKSIKATRKVRKVTAADEMEDPRIEQLDDLHARVEDDFDYVLAGIERLGRENMLDEALNLLTTLSDTLNSAISIIGEDFDKGSDNTDKEI